MNILLRINRIFLLRINKIGMDTDIPKFTGFGNINEVVKYTISARVNSTTYITVYRKLPDCILSTKYILDSTGYNLLDSTSYRSEKGIYNLKDGKYHGACACDDKEHGFCIRYRNNGKLDSPYSPSGERTPSVIRAFGVRLWHSHGAQHRDHGKPAVIYRCGSKEWYSNDVLHRENGPAIEHASGRKEWYFNGKLHRVDGPAVETKSGLKKWYKNGVLHREDGPAVINPNGSKEWWFDGKKRYGKTHL